MLKRRLCTAVQWETVKVAFRNQGHARIHSYKKQKSDKGPIDFTYFHQKLIKYQTNIYPTP